MPVADVTVCIPSIPPRAAHLQRAVASVTDQLLQPKEVSIAMDEAGNGASVTRNATTVGVDTKWLAFLDDDDEFMPHHLQALLAAAEETDADYLFGTFVVPEAPGFRLESFCYDEFDPTAPLQTTITILIKNEVFHDVGGYLEPDQMMLIHGDTVGEDYDFTKRCCDAGVKIHHVQDATWFWHHHGGNTSGRKWNR